MLGFVAFAAILPLIGSPSGHPLTRPRLLVLTDIGGDPDDQQSMIRLMTGRCWSRFGVVNPALPKK